MERALLVTADLGDESGWTARDRAAELKELASSAGAKVIDEVIVHRQRIDPAYFIGSGKAEELALACGAKDIKLVIFNNDLSGTQQKNLEEAMACKTIDRTQLILDIFARHAHSNEGKLQVELAQLMYMLPRLTGKGIYLSRLGGGIGTRGPGEQKLEVDRRRIRSRIFRVKKELEGLEERRAMMRKNRERFSALSVAIVGYTNVGKSTLMNALTASDVIVQDKLFSTLDPTTRCFIMPNKQKALFIDTVGFLDRLPHHLIEAFKATLEEVAESDLILHLVDASHPKALEQAAAVYKVLDEIGAKDKTVVTALNKIDKVSDAAAISAIAGHFVNPVLISALKKEGFNGLVERILPYADIGMKEAEFLIPPDETRLISSIYENGVVVSRECRDGGTYIKARVSPRALVFLKKYVIL